MRRFRDEPRQRRLVLDTGLWRYTRHPNYFGEALLWWGFGLIGAATGGVLGLIVPAIMTYLLIYVSGVALLERSLLRRRDTRIRRQDPGVRSRMPPQRAASQLMTKLRPLLPEQRTRVAILPIA